MKRRDVSPRSDEATKRRSDEATKRRSDEAFFTTGVNLMRTGWTCKEAAVVLNVAVNRVTQALDPALTKVAKLYRADPTRTLRAILDRVEELPLIEDAITQQLFERELPVREAMMDGSPGLPPRCPA